MQGGMVNEALQNFMRVLPFMMMKGRKGRRYSYRKRSRVSEEIKALKRARALPVIKVIAGVFELILCSQISVAFTVERRPSRTLLNIGPGRS